MSQVVICRIKFQSVAPSSPRKSDGKLRGALRHCFSRIASAPRSFSRKGLTGILQFLGPFKAARRFFCSLLKYPQKSLSGLRVGFSHLLGFVGFHANQPNRRQEVWRTQIKGISNP